VAAGLTPLADVTGNFPAPVVFPATPLVLTSLTGA